MGGRVCPCDQSSACTKLVSSWREGLGGIAGRTYEFSCFLKVFSLDVLVELKDAVVIAPCSRGLVLFESILDAETASAEKASVTP